MSDKQKKENEKLKAHCKKLQERNVELVKRLSEATELLHQGHELVGQLESQVAVLQTALADKAREHVAALAESDARVVQCVTAADAAEQREQEHKKRLAATERKAHMLSKAVRGLASSKQQKRDAEECVALAVQSGALSLTE